MASENGPAAAGPVTDVTDQTPVRPGEPSNRSVGRPPNALPTPAPRALVLPSLPAQPAREFEPRVERLEQELDAARRGGVWGLWRLRYEAWLEERLQHPAIRKMQARQAVLAEQCKTAEAEIRLRAVVQSGEVGAQRQRIEWNEVSRQRLAGELQALGLVHLAPAPAGALASAAVSLAPPPVSPHVTDEQVEALALRAFVQGAESEEDWDSFKGELSRHLAPYAVEEVGARLRELWRLNRQATGL